jgi:voltage-gated potassium channel
MAAWRERVRRIIFEADTPAGRLFDVTLLWIILGSIVAVMLESVTRIGAIYGPALRIFEWVVTGLFTIEYALRVATVREPLRYARSFFGIVDLIAILPSFLSLVLPGTQSLLMVRSLRLLRVFRVLKLVSYLGEANVLIRAVRASIAKVTVFLGAVLVLVAITGTAIYLIEGEKNGFTSIPRSMYWAVVTITTVGYGDIAPQTVLGQMVAAVVMLMGYCIIAVPMGIVSAELVEARRNPITTRTCPTCTSEGHTREAHFCLDCGGELAPNRAS